MPPPPPTGGGGGLGEESGACRKVALLWRTMQHSLHDRRAQPHIYLLLDVLASLFQVAMLDPKTSTRWGRRVRLAGPLPCLVGRGANTVVCAYMSHSPPLGWPFSATKGHPRRRRVDKAGNSPLSEGHDTHTVVFLALSAPPAPGARFRPPKGHPRRRRAEHTGHLPSPCGA